MDMDRRIHRHGTAILIMLTLAGCQDDRHSWLPSSGTPSAAPANPEGAVVAEVIEPPRRLERGGWSLVVRPAEDASEVGGLDELVVVVAEDAASRCEGGEPAHPSDIEVGSSVLLPSIHGVGLSNPPTVGVSEITARDC